jgi:hypothetical protein
MAVFSVTLARNVPEQTTIVVEAESREMLQVHLTTVYQHVIDSGQEWSPVFDSTSAEEEGVHRIDEDEDEIADVRLITALDGTIADVEPVRS